MARCLRCGAGNEWIQPIEREPRAVLALEADLARERERAEKAERLLREAEEAIRFADLLFVEESMRSTSFAELSFANWITHPAVRRALGKAEGEGREG